MNRILLCLVGLPLLLTTCTGPDTKNSTDDLFQKGADLSFLQEVEANGAVFKANGSARDGIQIFSENGFNYVRFRLWHTPDKDYYGTPKMITLAKRARQAGMHLLLDFHYSDSWADPGKQYPPAAWTNLGYSELSNAVYAYSRDTIASFRAEGVLPNMVQIGNEITPGMLWPLGQVANFSKTNAIMYIRGTFNNWETTSMTLVSNYTWECVVSNVSTTDRFQFDAWGNWGKSFGDTNSDWTAETNTGAGGDIYFPAGVEGAGYAVVCFNEVTLSYSITSNGTMNDANWTRFTGLLKAGIAGVKQGAGSERVPLIMIHIDRGGDNQSSRSFFDRMARQAVPYDQIGLSWYPWWHGTLQSMQTNVADLVARYGKPVVIVETAYPWTLDWNDDQHNIVGSVDKLHPGYPATVAGQQAFLTDVIAAVRAAGGSGVYYWAPDHVAIPGMSSAWENLALFDFDLNVLDSIKAFQ